MLDRGLRRSFPAGVERAAAEAVEKVDPDARRRARDLRSLATFTIDPATARDFDDAISAEAIGEAATRGACGSTSPTSARTSGRGRRSTARPTGAGRRSTSRARSSRCCPRCCPTARARWCRAQERLAVTVELEVRGEEVVRSVLLPLADPQRSSVWTTTASTGSSRARRTPREPWAAPLAAARAASAALRARRERAGALAVESTEPEFAFDRGGHVEARRRRCRPSPIS